MNLFRSILTPWDLAPTIATLEALPFRVKKCTSLFLNNEYEGKLSVVKLNVDESPSTPGKYGIRAIPTLILFKNGEVVEQVTGAVSKSSIATMIEQKALA